MRRSFLALHCEKLVGFLGYESVEGPLKLWCPGASKFHASPHSASKSLPKSPFKSPYEFMAPAASGPDKQVSLTPSKRQLSLGHHLSDGSKRHRYAVCVAFSCCKSGNNSS